MEILPTRKNIHLEVTIKTFHLIFLDRPNSDRFFEIIINVFLHNGGSIFYRRQNFFKRQNVLVAQSTMSRPLFRWFKLMGRWSKWSTKRLGKQDP